MEALSPERVREFLRVGCRIEAAGVKTTHGEGPVLREVVQVLPDRGAGCFLLYTPARGLNGDPAALMLYTLDEIVEKLKSGAWRLLS